MILYPHRPAKKSKACGNSALFALFGLFGRGLCQTSCWSSVVLTGMWMCPNATQLADADKRKALANKRHLSPSWHVRNHPESRAARKHLKQRLTTDALRACGCVQVCWSHGVSISTNMGPGCCGGDYHSLSEAEREHYSGGVPSFQSMLRRASLPPAP